MHRQNLLVAVFVALLLAAPLLALIYLAHQLAGAPFLPFDLFDGFTRVLPGPLITLAIDVLIDALRILGLGVSDTAKSVERALAVLLFFLTSTAAGLLFLAIVSRRGEKPRTRTGLFAGLLFGLPLLVISFSVGQSSQSPILSFLWSSLLFPAWGLALSYTAGRLLSPPAARDSITAQPPTDVQRMQRRQFLIQLGASTATITVAGATVGALLARREREFPVGADDSEAGQTLQRVQRTLPNAGDPVLSVPGTRPEYTPLEEHYQVTIRAEPTVIDEASWILPIGGLVQNPLALTLDDLRGRYEVREQYVTLSCISGRVGGDLIGTTLWSGASMQEVLADVRVLPEARYLNITSGDGYHETVSLRLLAEEPRIMLCYAWDGRPLPVEHGFPLRIWIPDRYGMKQPKWITGIEVTDEYREGFWVERNWDEVAQVEATSVIDTVAVEEVIDDNGRALIPVGGFAFAGARGISRVEVRVDDGPWQRAQLRSPLSETTWIMWRYEWPFSPGEHLFEVRCVDGTGVAQKEERRPTRPSGATGIHAQRVTL